MKIKMQDLVNKAVEQAREAKAKGAVVGDQKGAAAVSKKELAKKSADLENRWFKAFAARDSKALAELQAEVKEQYKAADLSGQNITDDANGGFLVPLTVESTIIKKLEATSEIRKYATVISNVVGDLKLGAEDVLVQAYWVVEGDEATLDEAEFADVTLRPVKAIGFGKFTDEVLTQTASNPDIRRMVVDQFAVAIQRLEDAAYTNGDGNGKPLGYRTLTLPAGHTVTAGDNTLFDDTMALYRALPKAYRANGTFMLNDITAALYDTVKDSDGRPLLNTFDADNERIKGRPVAYDPNLPDAEAWFGDYSKYVIADGGGIRVDYGLEGDDFKRSKISVRVIHYTDGAPVLAEAFAKATGLNNTPAS